MTGFCGREIYSGQPIFSTFMNELAAPTRNLVSPIYRANSRCFSAARNIILCVLKRMFHRGIVQVKSVTSVRRMNALVTRDYGEQSRKNELRLEKLRSRRYGGLLRLFRIRRSTLRRNSYERIITR